MKEERLVDCVPDTTIKEELEELNVAGPRRIEVDATEDGEGYRIVGPSPEVVVISDDN